MPKPARACTYMPKPVRACTDKLAIQAMQCAHCNCVRTITHDRWHSFVLYASMFTSPPTDVDCTCAHITQACNQSRAINHVRAHYASMQSITHVTCAFCICDIIVSHVTPLTSVLCVCCTFRGHTFRFHFSA